MLSFFRQNSHARSSKLVSCNKSATLCLWLGAPRKFHLDGDVNLFDVCQGIYHITQQFFTRNSNLPVPLYFAGTLVSMNGRFQANL